MVSITVQDLNEAPDFADDAATKLRITENQATIVVDDDSEAGGNLDAYEATDEDAGDTRTYSLGGDDASAFEIDNTSFALTFPEADGPNFESKSSYSIIIKVTDANDLETDHMSLTTEFAVTVRVVNLDEDGEVTFTQVQPQVGVPITAMLSDPDKGITGTMWQWSSETGTANEECNNTGSFTPIEGCDVGNLHPDCRNLCLRATAYYSDTVDSDGVDNVDTENIDESLDTANNSAG